ncbi:transposase [Rhizobium sullae]|uniref:Transposase n=1 Tax=Rhizobium sullae TaxID=50338 RepID=A0A4R3Q5E6_RHISU|nr:transposase [Rhizobium sullae]
MKASQFSDAQRAFILKQGDEGVPVAEICRKAGIGEATYFNWKKKYAGMLPPEMKKLACSEAGGGEGHVPRLGDLDPACLRSCGGNRAVTMFYVLFDAKRAPSFLEAH